MLELKKHVWTLRDCKEYSNLAQDLYDKDVDEFWSSVRQLNHSRAALCYLTALKVLLVKKYF